MGKVYLIGVGPYDEELITLKAIRILKKCDVVLYDRLVNKNILKYLRDDCKIYYCGKESGNHIRTQQEINDMLVRFAKEGYTVGRIKGGDPFVFGRGSEEALRLYEEGIDFEIVPGISSAIAVPCYAGIPVTHRKVSQSFHVFTGRSAEKLNFDWSIISKLTGTLIFLMATETFKDIAQHLLLNGMDQNKPCAIISRGTSVRQRTHICTLKEIPNFSEKNRVESPAVFVVGDVVSFRKFLNWYETKPLFGRKICITRPKKQSIDFKEKLLDLGAEVVEANSIKLKSVEDNLEGYSCLLDSYDLIVFTSVNGVDIFFEYLIKKGYDVRRIKAQFACIGSKTFEALRKRGIIAEYLAEEFVSEALFEKIRPILKRGFKIFLPRAKNARRFLKDMLIKEGCRVDEVVLYEVLTESPTEIELYDVDYFTFTSPSTVASFVNLYGSKVLRGKKIIAIGPITADKLREFDLKSEIAFEYATDGIIRKILSMEGYHV